MEAGSYTYALASRLPEPFEYTSEFKLKSASYPYFALIPFPKEMASRSVPEYT